MLALNLTFAGGVKLGTLRGTNAKLGEEHDRTRLG